MIFILISEFCKFSAGSLSHSGQRFETYNGFYPNFTDGLVKSDSLFLVPECFFASSDCKTLRQIEGIFQNYVSIYLQVTEFHN